MIQDFINAKNFKEFTLELYHKICGKSKKTEYEFVRFGPTSGCEIRTSTASPAQWLRHSLEQETGSRS